jgi:hypothetical protein
MLIFCNNFFSATDIEFLVNTQTDECFMLIQKNGTQSLTNLAIIKPKKFKIVSINYLKENNINKVTVFVREPIGRVISGLNTQKKLLKISKQELEVILNQEETFYVYDLHTVPQFWFLLKLSTVADVKFQIKPMSELASVDTDIKNIHISYLEPISITNPKILERLVHFYTEDIVLCNQFLNTLSGIDSIIEKIKLEKDFINDLQQYRQVLTYLL